MRSNKRFIKKFIAVALSSLVALSPLKAFNRYEPFVEGIRASPQQVSKTLVVGGKSLSPQLRDEIEKIKRKATREEKAEVKRDVKKLKKKIPLASSDEMEVIGGLLLAILVDFRGVPWGNAVKDVAREAIETFYNLPAASQLPEEMRILMVAWVIRDVMSVAGAAFRTAAEESSPVWFSSPRIFFYPEDEGWKLMVGIEANVGGLNFFSAFIHTLP